VLPGSSLHVAKLVGLRLKEIDPFPDDLDPFPDDLIPFPDDLESLVSLLFEFLVLLVEGQGEGHFEQVIGQDLSPPFLQQLLSLLRFPFINHF